MKYVSECDSSPASPGSIFLVETKHRGLNPQTPACSSCNPSDAICLLQLPGPHSVATTQPTVPSPATTATRPFLRSFTDDLHPKGHKLTSCTRRTVLVSIRLTACPALRLGEIGSSGGLRVLDNSAFVLKYLLLIFSASCNPKGHLVFNNRVVAEIAASSAGSLQNTFYTDALVSRHR